MRATGCLGSNFNERIYLNKRRIDVIRLRIRYENNAMLVVCRNEKREWLVALPTRARSLTLTWQNVLVAIL